jgi:hypothetical protein
MIAIRIFIKHPYFLQIDPNLVAIIDRDSIISKNTRGLGLVPHASGAAAVAGLAIRIRKAPFSPPDILSRPSTAKLSTHLHLQLY